MIGKLKAQYDKLSKRERRALAASALVIALVAADRLVLGPLLERYARLEQQIRDEEAAVRQSLAVLLQKQQITVQSRELSAFAVDARDPETEMTSLLKDLEGLAQSASVSLLYVKPVNTKDDKGVKRFYAALECEGTMEQVADFYYSIETSPKLLRIEKYTIQPKARDSSVARCAVTVSKTAFS